MEQIQEISEAEAKKNREAFRQRMKDEGKLEPFEQQKEAQRPKEEFHGFQ
jgi:preprotein translocase subunit SecD